MSRSRARADSKAVDNAKATCLTHNSDAKKSDGLRRSPVDKRQETDEKQHKQGQVADSSEAQAKVDASISREIRSDDETNLANSHAQSKDHIDRSDRADGEDYERIRNREYEEYRRRIEDGDEQEEEEEEDDNDESSKNSRPSNSGAAEIFMQTAMSLGMDNDDLLFNLMYFEEMGSAPPNFSSLLNSMQTETLALHSENNTPYKLNPASESAMDGLTRGTFSPQEHDQDKECDICKDEMEVGCRTAKVPHCGHYFHEECLIRWVKLV